MADGDRVRLTVRQVELARELGVPAAFRNFLGMDFVLVPPGTFEMGSPPRSRIDTRASSGTSSRSPGRSISSARP